MRIIAGTSKGHTIKCLKGTKVRPTLDRVREAVFNVIGSKIVEARFLDLFAGTGAIGIEALSRGAELCYFNDVHRNSAQLIVQNLINCKLQEKGKVFNMTALKLANNLCAEGQVIFDLVYLDPPYEEGLYLPVLGVLSQDKTIIKADSTVIVESNTNLSLENRINNLELSKKSVYGDTIIWYYQYI